MILRALAAAALLLPATFALADGDFSRTLTVSAQPDLYVQTNSGSIRIHAGSEGRIEIRGHVHTSGWNLSSDIKTRAEQILANPPISQSGNTIHIGSDQDRAREQNISIDYELAVPPSVALNLRSGSGDIEVNQVGRFLAAFTGSGSVRAHGLHGPAELQTGSGDVELDETAGGEVKAKTGSGSIRIRGLQGALTAVSGTGDIEALGQLDGPSRLTTGSGSLRLHLSPNSHFNLDATTGSGTIRVHFPGAPQGTEPPPHHLELPINGGGPTLQLHTGSGDIEITTN